MKKLVYGVGVNDADNAVTKLVDGKRVASNFYSIWARMFKRCYSDKYHAEYPTYIDCTVCAEWVSFIAFRAWMMEQDWEGKDLDKDIIKPGNKVYSPDTCAFVDRKINTLVGGKPPRDLPLGVFLTDTGKYQAECEVDGKRCYLGRFDDKYEAGRVYSEFKAKVIIRAALTQPDRRVFLGLLRHAKLILDNGRSLIGGEG